MGRFDADLAAAFNVRASELVAFVGGGGKTSLMMALAGALPGRVVMTTTTRIFAAQIKSAPAVCFWADDQTPTGLKHKRASRYASVPIFPYAALSDALDQFGCCLVVGALGADQDREKALGVPPTLPGQLLARQDVDFVLVEADGSRMRPIKAPAAHEPVIPPETTLVVPMMGIDALAGRIADVAHRPELVCAILGDGCGGDNQLTAAAAATLFTHSQGGLKNVLAGARVIPFINKVETAEQLDDARQIAHLALQNRRIDRVVIGALRSGRPVREVHQRVTAVVLAAGRAARMAQTKQLLPWGDTTVLGQVLRHLQRTAVHDIVVVTGHETAQIEAVAAAAGVATVFNPQYDSGEMLSSLQTAVRQLPAEISAVLVMLADQPMVESAVIDQVLAAYWRGESDLIAPAYRGKRGNPALIGRAYFDELLALPPRSAPRHLLQRHDDRLRLVEVGTATILRDLDTPADYERWRR